MWGSSGGGGYGITSDTTDTGYAASGVNQYIGGISAPAVGNSGGVPWWGVALAAVAILLLLKK